MSKVNSVIPCPTCQGAMQVRKLHCQSCDLSVEGRFSVSDLGDLSHAEMHFLRIFVLCEGKIKDVERALGVSYPTVKGQLGRLKAKFSQDTTQDELTRDDRIKKVIQKLEAKKIDISEALDLIKNEGDKDEQ